MAYAAQFARLLEGVELRPVRSRYAVIGTALGGGQLLDRVHAVSITGHRAGKIGDSAIGIQGIDGAVAVVALYAVEIRSRKSLPGVVLGVSGQPPGGGMTSDAILPLPGAVLVRDCEGGEKDRIARRMRHHTPGPFGIDCHRPGGRE